MTALLSGLPSGSPLWYTLDLQRVSFSPVLQFFREIIIADCFDGATVSHQDRLARGGSS